MRDHQLQPRYSEYIPADLEDGVLYVSLDYATAVHRCACGCGHKVVTPLGPAGWQLVFDGSVSLRPSIGNGQFPCRSHYFVRNNQVIWVQAMSPQLTRHAQQRDQEALVAHRAPAARVSTWSRLKAALLGRDLPE